MKKSSAKSTAAKSAASAKSPAKKSVAAVKKTAPAAAPVVAKPVAKPAAKPAAAAKAPKAKPAAAKPPVKTAAVTTTIVAAIDVGFGNSLAIRGEGPGLSWEAGVPLECSADDRWTITLPETSHPIICKFLINDITWCAGEDYTVLPGSSVVLSPTF